MDENYLDNLLNELSLDKEIDHNVEDELDNQLQTMRSYKDTVFNRLDMSKLEIIK